MNWFMKIVLVSLISPWTNKSFATYKGRCWDLAWRTPPWSVKSTALESGKEGWLGSDYSFAKGILSIFQLSKKKKKYGVKKGKKYDIYKALRFIWQVSREKTAPAIYNTKSDFLLAKGKLLAENNLWVKQRAQFMPHLGGASSSGIGWFFRSGHWSGTGAWSQGLVDQGWIKICSMATCV